MERIRIIGAGLAGLLAACRWPEAKVFERNARSDGPNHRALLRFRSDEVSKLTGVPFRAVRVDKGVFFDGTLRSECSIALANRYARKVTGVYTGGRSVWNLASEQRWIAPEDFQEQLAAKCDDRITYHSWLYEGDFSKDAKVATISTIPMRALLDMVPHEYPVENVFKFEPSGIYVRRFRLPEGTDLFQTVYFPSDQHAVYRASVTGSMLIVEETQRHWNTTWNTGMEWSVEDAGMEEVLKAFGIDNRHEIDFIDAKLQEYGKIIDMPRGDAQAIMYELTREYNVFSLGRFATWRNILLDDVVKDMEVIDSLINASSYSRHRMVGMSVPKKPSNPDDDIPF